jgi:long-chain acyl-CoA synthetase
MENVDTLPKLVRNNYQKWGHGVAMAMKNFGLWQRYTWKDYYEKVKHYKRRKRWL